MIALEPAARAPGIERSPSLRVLLVTNMYPTETEPWYGSFVRDQVESLRTMGVDVVVLSFDGRRDPLNYVRAARKVRALVGREQFDLVHAHYGLTGAVAAAQRQLPLVTTFHGSDYNGWSPWQRRVSRIVARHSTSIVMTSTPTDSLRARLSGQARSCG